MKNAFFILLAILLLFCTPGCDPEETGSGTGQHVKKGVAKYIPATADVVFSFDIANILRKTDRVREKDVYETIFSSLLTLLPNERFRTALGNPTEWGICHTGRAHVFLEMPSHVQEDEPHYGFVIPLRKGEAFSAKMWQAERLGITEIVRLPSYNYVMLPNALLGWTYDALIVLYYEKTNNLPKTFDAIMEGERAHQTLYYDTETFNTLMKDEWDACAWVDYFYFFQGALIGEDAFSRMISYPLLSRYKGAEANAKMTFEAGRVIVTTESRAGETPLFPLRYEKRYTSRLFDYVSGKNLVFLATYAINMRAYERDVTNIIANYPDKRLRLRLDRAFTRFGLTFDEVLSVFTGDFIVAVSDIDKKERTVALLLGATVTRRDRLDTFLASLAEKGIVVKEERGAHTYYRFTAQRENPLFAIRIDDLFFIVTKEYKDYYTRGVTLPEPLAPERKRFIAKGNVGALFFDFRTFRRTAPEDSSDAFGKILESLEETLVSLSLTSSVVDDTVSKGTFTITLADASRNALDVLADWFVNDADTIRKAFARNKESARETTTAPADASGEK